VQPSAQPVPVDEQAAVDDGRVWKGNRGHRRAV
jgi:hypothetical protein